MNGIAVSKPKDVFTVQRDGNVYRWYRYRWPCGILSSKESFASVEAATEAATVVAKCENALFTSAYTGDPAVARWASEGAPSCGATWTGDYDVLPADQRDDYIGM